ncbi:MAG: hypothetical protein K0R61_5430, partial [Microvirga sp.]|nr:hypothetical protein [Microvirga sp.]
MLAQSGKEGRTGMIPVSGLPSQPKRGHEGDCLLLLPAWLVPREATVSCTLPSGERLCERYLIM